DVEEDATVSGGERVEGKVLKVIKVGPRPRGIAFLPDASKAYISCENAESLSVIDAVKLEAAGKISIGEGTKPMGLAMTKDGKTLYVSTGRGKNVVVVDTASEKILKSFEVGQRPWGIALSPDEKLLCTANGPSN